MPINKLSETLKISTHTLRGERDSSFASVINGKRSFQLTRSVGSVTDIAMSDAMSMIDFNSHAPWGA